MQKSASTHSDSFIVRNSKGLHTRPCAELVRCAGRFKSMVWLLCGQRRVEAKSLLGVLTLAAGQGTLITVLAEGSDSQQAVAAIIELANRDFDHEY